MEPSREDYQIYNRVIPERSAVYAEFPQALWQELKAFLETRGIKQLYSHQAEMFERAMEGKNLVITTSTASGKTLSFLLPVMQKILEDPSARAIFIYPTKALASDQYRALQPYLEYFKGKVAAGVYDGDTPTAERTRIRQSANIILTNPEMVNSAFLPNHSKYGIDLIFANLQYVVIDELHTYRGAFGSHFANVMRRLHRVCRYYHASPRFLCSSATIANPLELAEEICGCDFHQIDRDGSPAPERKYVFLQPPKIKGKDDAVYGQVPAANVAAELIEELAGRGTSFIAFAKSRRNVEVILKEARDRLEAEDRIFGRSGSPERISGYRGGYTPKERKEIERKMIEGQLAGLVSTNALELGIDIGKIDATILVGYPGTRASFWQRTGRAGRSGKECTNYLILEELPFDQYIVINPRWLFENSSENAVIDKNNLLIELSHIRAAAAEIPLTLDDIALFPDLGETIPVLLHAGELNSAGGRFLWSGDSFPAGDYSLRNIDRNRYRLMNEESGQMITEMDEMQAYREIHEGAIYLHDGMQYQIRKMDLEGKVSYAVPFSGNYYTMPGGNTRIDVIKWSREQQYGRLKAAFGDVKVEDIIHMYKKLQFHNHQNLGFEQLKRPLEKTFETEGTGIVIPKDVVRIYRRVMRVTANGAIIRNNHFEGLCYALKNAARMLTMTEEEDIGVVMSDNIAPGENSLAEAFDEVYLYFYDQYIGGLGYAEKIYELLPQIIDKAIEMVGGCSCAQGKVSGGGCVACVGDHRLDRNLVLWGLRSMLEEIAPPKEIRMGEDAPEYYVKKPFVFRELGAKWQEFCAFLQSKGESHAAFLHTIAGVETEGAKLRLYTENDFYRTWMMEENNRKAIVNLLKFYTDAPAGVTMEAVIVPQEKKQQELKNQEQRLKQEKLTRRLGSLKGDRED